jgi:hypothetical protein
MSKELLLAIRTVKDAVNDIGIKMAGGVNEKGEYVKRGPHGDGWNDCLMEMHRKIYDRLKLLEEGQIDKNLLFLSLADVGYFDEEYGFMLNMNDTFHYACSDCEEVSEEEAKEVVRLFCTHGYKGLEYWVAEKRGYDPEIPHYLERVKEVRAIEEKRKKEKEGQK